MNAPRDEVPTRGRRLPSVFENLTPGKPLLEELEYRMETDTSNRILVVLERVLVTKPDPLPSEPVSPP